VDEQQIMVSIAAKYPEAKLIGPWPSKETDMALYSQIEAEMMEAKKRAYQDVCQPGCSFTLPPSSASGGSREKREIKTLSPGLKLSHRLGSGR
jgi:hypothetical protein